MSTFNFTVESPAVGGATPAERNAQIDRLWGRDLWLDITVAKGANLLVTAAGDWRIADGREALRQWIIRCIVTNPGEWQTLPDYGCGARLYVKARNTRAMRDELSDRIKSQLLRNPRIEKVEKIVIDNSVDGVLRIAVVVQPQGRLLMNEPLVAAVEVS